MSSLWTGPSPFPETASTATHLGLTLVAGSVTRSGEGGWVLRGVTGSWSADGPPALGSDLHCVVTDVGTLSLTFGSEHEYRSFRLSTF